MKENPDIINLVDKEASNTPEVKDSRDDIEEKEIKKKEKEKKTPTELYQASHRELITFLDREFSAIKQEREDNLQEVTELWEKNTLLLIENHRLQVYEDINWFQVFTNGAASLLLAIAGFADENWKPGLLFLGIGCGIMGIILHFPPSKIKAWWTSNENTSPNTNS